MRHPLGLACLTALTAGALAIAGPAAAQKGGPPPRPRLAVGADTNDPRAYLARGAASLSVNPSEALAAFYWASRLRPDLADALYGRRVAYLLTDNQRLIGYMRGLDRVVESAEMRRVDSLYYRAMTIDPLFHRHYDALLFRTFIEEVTMAQLRNRYGAEAEAHRPEMSYLIASWQNGADARTLAWRAYSDGRFADAVERYREALRSARKNERVELEVELGRTYALTGNADSAVTHFQLALDALRARDEKKTVRWYDSKALLEQSVGMAFERDGQEARAREAYGRALQEDLAYYPAHAGLGRLALARGDTATAIAELDLAVQVKQDDPTLRYLYAVALITGGRSADAATHLRRAVELEPFYPDPYYALGRLHESASMTDEALAHYRSFVTRAPAYDVRLPDARARIRQLEGEATTATTAPPVAPPTPRR